jgi:transcriptional regulator with XRE-family HTH domain
MRLLREARGISQAEIATRVTRLGVPLPQQTIARIETGKRALRLDEAEVIARALSSDLLEMVSDPVEVRDARKQLAEAIKHLDQAHDERFDAEAAHFAAERDTAELAGEVARAREREAEMQAVVERLREAVSKLDEGDEE